MKPPRRRKKNGFAGSVAPGGKPRATSPKSTSSDSLLDGVEAKPSTREDDGSVDRLTLTDVLPARDKRVPRVKAGPAAAVKSSIASAGAIRMVDEFAGQYPFTLDDFQIEAMRSLAGGNSVLVTAPTGTGKTVIAEYAAHLGLEGGGRVIYTTPLRALSAQKFRDFAAIWGVERVGLITGETSINEDAPILVMTTEILRNRLVSEAARTLDTVRAVVLDEFHFLADADRGRVWEEVVLLLPRSVQLVCLSATIPNSRDVTQWIVEVHGPTDLVIHDQRSVPLDVWYATNGRIQRVADSSGTIVARPKPAPKPEIVDRARPATTPEIVDTLFQRRFLPAIVFVMSRRRTEEWAASAVEAGLDLIHDGESRQTIEEQLRLTKEKIYTEELALSQLEQLAEALRLGLAFHHAGLVPVLRELVERLFEANLVGTAFATGTLALGINMPARTVVLEQLSSRDDRGWRPIAKREFLQMAGRAGRRGMDPIGHIVILENKFDGFEALERVLRIPPEPVVSSFQVDFASALYLLERYGSEGMAEMYRRSFATFSQILTAERNAAGGKSGSKGSPVFLIRRKAQIERQVADQAGRVEAVLARFQYWDGRKVTERARFLRRFFHGNALLASELILSGALTKLTPAELAEAASWIEGSGRSGRGRRIPSLPGHLQSVHRVVTTTDRKVRRVEQDNLIDISTGLGPLEILGLIYRAMLGDSLTELCADYGLDPGDLYGRLTETRMWLRQLEGALTASELDPQLLATSKIARAMLSEKAGTVGFTPATEGLL